MTKFIKQKHPIKGGKRRTKRERTQGRAHKLKNPKDGLQEKTLLLKAL
jgi:hypothetical protein